MLKTEKWQGFVERKYRMSGFRAYCENLGDAKVGDTLALSADESRHLCGALRANLGDLLSLFDLNSNALEAQLVKVSPKSAEVKILKELSLSEKKIKISLAQALPKGGAFDAIVDNAVQVGADKIYPLISERTIVRLDASDIQKKHDKWTQNLIESMKQSGNLHGLELFKAAKFSDFLGMLPASALKLVASLEKEKTEPLLCALEKAGLSKFSEICVLVGPEGDFSANEYKAAYAAGFIPVCLGENVLKSDNAANFALAVVSAYAQAFFNK